MNSLTPVEIVQYYADAGKKKAEREAGKIILLAVLAGAIVAFGGIMSSTAVHSIENAGVAKIVSGLLFPFVLAIIMLLGAELFTGNCMIPISIIEGKTTLSKMLRSWALVYAGNFFGSVLIAYLCVFSGQMELSGGKLGAYAIKIAASKCALSFPAAVGLGILCNILVCAGVLCSVSAKDTSGRILGAYMPIAFFVIGGFEHCIANMYYIPAGILALSVPKYAGLAIEAGVDTGSLTWGAFFIKNLLPVTIGNIIGGVVFCLVMWAGHVGRGRKREPAAEKTPAGSASK